MQKIYAVACNIQEYRSSAIMYAYISKHAGLGRGLEYSTGLQREQGG